MNGTIGHFSWIFALISGSNSIADYVVMSQWSTEVDIRTLSPVFSSFLLFCRNIELFVRRKLSICSALGCLTRPSVTHSYSVVQRCICRRFI